jgi:predicted transcriptional regulator
MLSITQRKSLLSTEKMESILRVAVIESSRTRITRMAYLPYQRLTGAYLPFLLATGLLECNNGLYKTTEKGKWFLKEYNEALKLIE